MLNINKPYKIYAESIESEAIEQFSSAMNQEFTVRGALMPDVHTGYSLPIGAVIATKNVIVPAWVGYDIGCGMMAIKTSIKKEQITDEIKTKIFDNIYRDIPMGMGREREYAIDRDFCSIERTPLMDSILQKNIKQCGSLGSGNHFLEIGHDTHDNIWAIVHSGSRGVGHMVATYYMRLASNTDKAKEGHFGLRTDTQEGKDYIMDMGFCLEFALINREIMLRQVIDIFDKYFNNYVISDVINENHNHAEYKDGLWIHRKGATHADKGMKGVIPGNMRDGSFIVEGLGNEEALCSSSHGAGRIMSRTKAKKAFSLEEFSREMTGIVSKISNGTLDESPMAYKNIFEVMEQQKDLVKVIEHIRPLINIKAEGDAKRGGVERYRT